MIDKIVRLIVAGLVCFLVYLAFSLIIGAIVAATGFAWGAIVLAIIAGLLIIAFCVFVLRVFGVSF